MVDVWMWSKKESRVTRGQLVVLTVFVTIMTTSALETATGLPAPELTDTWFIIILSRLIPLQILLLLVGWPLLLVWKNLAPPEKTATAPVTVVDEVVSTGTTPEKEGEAQ